MSRSYNYHGLNRLSLEKRLEYQTEEFVLEKIGEYLGSDPDSATDSEDDTEDKEDELFGQEWEKDELYRRIIIQNYCISLTNLIERRIFSFHNRNPEAQEIVDNFNEKPLMEKLREPFVKYTYKILFNHMRKVGYKEFPNNIFHDERQDFFKNMYRRYLDKIMRRSEIVRDKTKLPDDILNIIHQYQYDGNMLLYTYPARKDIVDTEMAPASSSMGMYRPRRSRSRRGLRKSR